MDFLDPKKSRRDSIMLVAGYILVTIAVILGTIVLVYSAYGYGFGKNGSVIQNGFLYLSSTPSPANIYLNGSPHGTTNARLLLQEGIYNAVLKRPGYYTWSRTIELNGGTVESFTYPFLIPTTLTSTTYKSYGAAIQLITQSPNRQLLVVLQPGSDSQFDVYNLASPSTPPTTFSLPIGLLTSTTNESWQVIGWADDNQHVLIEHISAGTPEYILLDVANPTQSLNLSQTLSSFSFNQISLINNKYNQYYLYNSQTDTLNEVSLSNPTTPISTLTNIDAFAGYSNSTVLYATSKNAPAGKEDIDIYNGSNTYKVTELPAGTTYLLDIAAYNGTVYVAAGATSTNRVYVYQDPVSQLQNNPGSLPVPSWVLFVNDPNYISFSDSAQFIMIENGQQFAVYDIEGNHGYHYTTNYPLDSPQQHVSWMDGDRLTYVSGGKLLIFDYDNNYPHLLSDASPSYSAFFSPNYKQVYTVQDNGDLTKTLLTTIADQ